MRYSERRTARLTPMRDGSVAFSFSYDEALKEALKAEVPAHVRRWEPDQKYWLVAPQYAQICADLAQRYLGLNIEVPAITANHVSTTQLLKLEYLGAAKDRGNGEMSSFGWCNGGWNVIIPLKVLRNWFEPDQSDKPAENATLYGILGVARKSELADIKSAYRRAARTYHPDYNKEADASEQFRCIQHAWEILSDPVSRAKYDAGLRLTASLKHDRLPRTHKQVAHWKPPLRCGYILVECEQVLGRYVVSRILKWSDIVDSRGILVTYWPHGAKHFKEHWI